MERPREEPPPSWTAAPPLRELRRAARALGRGLLEELFPPRCLVCGLALEAGTVCEAHRLPTGPPGARCGRCRSALAPGLPDGYRCAACARAAPGFRTLTCLADYRRQAGVRDWILGLKHGARAELAGPLGIALARALERAERIEPDAPLVPVPAHPLRRFERGIDHGRLLAEAAGRAADRRVLRLLRRVRATPVQGAPGSVSRASNVRGAFGPRVGGLPGGGLGLGLGIGRNGRPREPPAAAVLVDDVVTSGATAAECARVLRRLGVRRVHVLCVARA